MQVSTTGTEEADAFLTKAMGYLNKKIPFVLQENVNSMVTGARGKHNFNTLNGGAERAIQGYISKDDWSLIFWINPAQVTVTSKNGKAYNYAWGLNDGTRSNYKQGKISPKVTPSRGNGGIKGDDFMGREFSKGIKTTQVDIKKAIIGAFK